MTYRYAGRYRGKTTKRYHIRKKNDYLDNCLENRRKCIIFVHKVKSMKAIRAKLKEVEKAVLRKDLLSQEEYDAYTSELKTLKELIAVKKAMASYEQDFGDAIDDEDGVPRQKRVSESAWD